MEEDLKEVLRRLEALEARLPAVEEEERQEDRIRQYLGEFKAYVDEMRERVLDRIAKGAGAISEPASAAIHRATSVVGESPLAVAALAFGAGLLLGALVRHHRD
ncbi:hypothetical protein Taci_0383 [Thermanaerovibrio acidaminovorans DSM 6589]|uniref:DUF883 domain-containing protein n=1 Tax=Thermanaerovibrio acidaminovorans (strain ATCC 49978 / DSM 6589 / Su883) TaxID=525903 RepID=D1B8L7_THEAS|nr:hypothetical protein [Thermanaerovibrio acidaminovorans]ACZ18620.1 hypothetical protein Taci_0383 [Thermanaerovibrio acidaminovorans DSM 6589]